MSGQHSAGRPTVAATCFSHSLRRLVLAARQFTVTKPWFSSATDASFTRRCLD